MLIEIWEVLRGYRKWSETEGIIESAKVHKEPVGERGILFTTTCADTLVWNDQMGQKHTAQFILPESSPLFSLRAGDAVTIRYDPFRPDHFYLRELSRTRVRAFFVNVLAGIGVALIFAAYILYHMIRMHYRRWLW